MSFHPGSILAAFEKEGGIEEVVQLYAEQGKPLVEQGVDVLIPGGGIPMLLLFFGVAFNID